MAYKRKIIKIKSNKDFYEMYRKSRIIIKPKPIKKIHKVNKNKINKVKPQADSYKFTFSAFDNLTDIERKTDSLWVLGTGYGITKLPKNAIQKLNNKTTLAFHNTFPHITTMHKIHPTYWSWLDPSAAMEGLQYLKNNAQQIIPIIHQGLVGDGVNFRKYFGNSLCNFYDYHNLLKNINTHTPFYIPKSTSIKALSWANKELVMNNPTKRTSFGFVVGSSYNSSKIDSNRHHKFESGMYMTENKLSSFIFPLAHFLGFKNIIYLGFEGTGPRFFQMNNNKIGAGRPGYNEGIENWSKWSKTLGINIISVISEKFSKTAKYFTYTEINEALERY